MTPKNHFESTTSYAQACTAKRDSPPRFAAINSRHLTPGNLSYKKTQNRRPCTLSAKAQCELNRYVVTMASPSKYIAKSPEKTPTMPQCSTRIFVLDGKPATYMDSEREGHL